MSPTRSSTRSTAASGGASSTAADPSGYEIPLVGIKVPPGLVETGFWGGLLAAAALGALDPPLALLVGAGVVVARHGRS